MSALDQIAISGAPGLVSALGIGTVFTCLTLLLFTMFFMGRVMAWVSGKSRAAGYQANNGTDVPGEMTQRPPSETTGKLPEQPEVAAAIAIAIARHRTRRTPSPAGEETYRNSWKLAGRLNAMKRL